MPTYIAEMERQQGEIVGSLPRIRGYQRSIEFEKWPETQLPCLLIISTGLIREPIREGKGKYRAHWGISVGVITSAATEARTRFLSQLYIAAVRAVLVQQKSWGGLLTGVTWLHESYEQIASEDERSVGAAMAVFDAEVLDVVTMQAGPAAPLVPQLDPNDPWDEDPIISTHENEVQLEGV